MSQNSPANSPLFTQLDITSSTPEDNPTLSQGEDSEQMRLLRELVAGQDRQNELLEELVGQLGATQKQRAVELAQWRRANPELSSRCRTATEALNRVQTAFIENLVEEAVQSSEFFIDGEFMFNEFVDRFGPRLAHLNGLLQVLSQLATVNTPQQRTNSK